MNKGRKTAAVVCVAVACLLVISACGVNYKLPRYAQVYETTGTMSKLLARQTSLEFGDYDEFSSNTSVKISTDKTYQNFYGFGAALTHSSAYLLMQEGAEAVRAEMFEQLFGETGARFNFLRVPIGASDYVETEEFFSCCDLLNNNDEDIALTEFNVDHDVNIIAALKEITAINPDIKIVAVPWSAPAWMKETHSLIGGALDSVYNDVFADYLVKFVQAYAEKGINISYLSLVNEPYVTFVRYPYMQMDGIQAAEITKLLGKKLANNKLDVKIMAWDHNVDYNAEDWMSAVYGDAECAKYVSGTAFHGYVQSDNYSFLTGCEYMAENYPDKEVYMTEITEHSGSNDFASNLAYAARYVTVAPVNAGSSAGMFWNLVLRSDGSPTPVSHGNECYGVMDMNETTDGFLYNKRSSYYAMAQISKFAYAVDGVYPKALRAESSNDTQILCCALYRNDGAVSVSVVNISDVLSENVDIVIDGKSVTYKVLPQSIVTFVC